MPIHDSETWFMFQNMGNYVWGKVKKFQCNILSRFRVMLKKLYGGGALGVDMICIFQWAQVPKFSSWSILEGSKGIFEFHQP